MPRKPNTNGDRYYDSFPCRLRELMERDGTKQEELKEVLKVKNRQSITGYIDGSTVPTIDKVVALADYFNVSTDYLLGMVNVSTTDTNLQAVCNFTGLSEKAVEQLAALSKQGYSSLDPILESKVFAALMKEIEELVDTLSLVDGKLDNPKDLDMYTRLMPELFQLDHADLEIEGMLRNIRYLNFQSGRTLEKLIDDIADFNRIEKKALDLHAEISGELEKYGSPEERRKLMDEYSERLSKGPVGIFGRGKPKADSEGDSHGERE